MDKHNCVLRFEFVPAQAVRRRHDGYGAGMLFLDGRPFWFSGSESDPQPVDWTWVDFLEHIAATWPALLAEQSYPFDWLNKSASHPGEIWMRADYRWASRDAALADEEEPVLYEFHRRHNLAAGWKGIGLPALVWLRVGNSVWLSPENGTPYRASEPACRNSLQAIGDQLAAAFEGSDNPRVAAAVQAWGLRGSFLQASFFELCTGFTTRELQQLQGSRAANAYWEVPEKTDWQNAPANESALLAVARMSRGILPGPAIARVIKKIRKTPFAKTPGLDELGRKAGLHLQHGQTAYAHESGYLLAQWVREQLPAARQGYFDIEAVLKSFNVDVTSREFDSSHIEAIAFWGLHGPCIMLNDNRAHDSHERQRMTLAHEFCHLLVDRKNALPAAEVLGGAIDPYVERRANAFAAELLLPREAVEQEAQSGHLRLSELLLIRQKFGVSKTVACAQIYNSRVFERLEAFEQASIEARVARLEASIQPEKTVSKIV